MLKSKKSVIITTAILVGTLSVGGTAYAYINNSKNISNAESTIRGETSSLNEISTELNKMTTKSGYVLSTATVAKLNNYKSQIKQFKDSYTDLNIDSGSLTGQLNGIKISKQSILNKISAIEKKLSIENKVNSLFTGKAIGGETVSQQPIKDSLTQQQISEIEKSITIKENSNWMKSIQDLINEATAQVQQVANAKQMVGAMVQNGKVEDGVSRDEYNLVFSEVNKIQNPAVKQSLSDQLTKVLAVVSANEVKVSLIPQSTTSTSKSSYTEPEPTKPSYSSTTKSSSSQTVQRAQTGSVSTGSNSNRGTGQPATVQGAQTGGGKIVYQNGADSGRTYTTGTFDPRPMTQTGSGTINGTQNTYTTGTADGSGIPWSSFTSK